MNLPKYVKDTNGIRYTLTRLLGRGGQGEVYEVEGGKQAVKRVSHPSAKQQERLRNQFAKVKRLPINDINIAKPIAMLEKPDVGYVMELLTEMVPIETLASPDEKSSLADWYIKTGGLKRRLLLLSKFANLLSMLHGKGLVYSDPSLQNVFISNSQEADQVWLIDSDNLYYESSPSSSVYTPGFGAPEVVQGKSGVNTLTDAFAFSVIVFKVLTLNHPFIGDLVHDGEPELEEKAFSGELPWIEDPDDTTNCCSLNIPSDLVLSKKLKELFRKAFGPGLHNPQVRPGMAEWAECLHTAYNSVIFCLACQSSYYFKETHCPWCEAPRSNFVTLAFHLWDPEEKALFKEISKNEKKEKIVAHAVVSESVPLVITERLAFGKEDKSAGLEVLEIQLTRKALSFRSLNSQAYNLTSKPGEAETSISENQKSLNLGTTKKSWFLEFGSPEKLHRVVSFRLREGNK